MNNYLKICVQFVCLLTVQVFIGNRLNFLGFVNPQICILFILWLPMVKKSLSSLGIAFCFGLALDVFSNSGGVNIAALLGITFFRIPLLSSVLRNSELDLEIFDYSFLNTIQKFSFVFILSLIHQFVINILEYYELAFLLKAFYKAFISSIFTTFVVLLLLSIFKPNYSS